MPPIATSALPLLPLEAGVVLPGMTITLALETDEAREAVKAAGGAGDRLVLVPRLGRSFNVGSISPAHTPVALMTARADISNDSPVRWSVSRSDVPVASDADV